MTSLIAVDRAIYSALVDDKVISVCSLEDQMSGHPANMITKPVLDFAVSMSSAAVSFFHSPA